MTHTPKIETVSQIWGEDGDYRFEVSEDSEALGMVELRYIETNSVKPSRIIMIPAHARLIAHCLLRAANELEPK